MQEAVKQTGNEYQSGTAQNGTPIDPDDREMFSNVMNLSDDVRERLLDRLGADKEAFEEQSEDIASEQREEENIRFSEMLEDRLKAVDEKMQKAFVVGKYSDHYRLHEKALVEICSYFSRSYGLKMESRVNAAVGSRQADRMLSRLQSQIAHQESKHQEYRKREEHYTNEINVLDSRIKTDEHALKGILKEIEEIDSTIEELKSQDDEEGCASLQRRADVERMSKDREKIHEMASVVGRRIKQNIRNLTWKEPFYENSRLARSESQYVLEQLKSHYDIVKNMREDYKKAGIPIEIKNGRLLLREMRKMQLELRDIQKEFSETMLEGTMRRWDYSGVQVGFNPHKSADGKDTMYKMREDEIRQAMKCLDKYNSSKK